MSYPNGVRKEVWVYVFDIKSPKSPLFLEEDIRRKRLLDNLKWNKPDFVSSGSAKSCGRDVVRKLYERGFLHPMKDLAPLALGLDFNPPRVFDEMIRLNKEQKKNEKIQSVPI